MPLAELSFEEVERMRQIVQMHDASRKPMTTTDLNNPPKEPYRFQKFPMVVYADNQTRIVRSEDELQSALGEGWSQDASSFNDKPEESLSAAYQMEAAQVQQKIEEASKRKPGRPRASEVA